MRTYAASALGYEHCAARRPVVVLKLVALETAVARSERKREAVLDHIVSGACAWRMHAGQRADGAPFILGVTCRLGATTTGRGGDRLLASYQRAVGRPSGRNGR